MTVEVMRVGQVVLVQDSRRPAAAGGQLQAWALLEWAELLRAVRLRGPAPVGVSSEFFGHVAVDVIGLEELLLGLDRHEKLRFNFAEWNAFVAGVLHGEFEPDALGVPARCEASSSVAGVGPEEEEAGASLRGGAPAEVAAGVCGAGAVAPAPVAADLDSPAGRPRDASTGEVVLSPADRPGSDAAGTGASPGPVPAARIWVLAEEPGPEVTHVIDADGDQWTHRLSVIDGCDWHLDEEGMDLSWPQLLVEYGPLTDATPAAAPLVPTDGAS
jgi:hypothetical protein